MRKLRVLAALCAAVFVITLSTSTAALADDKGPQKEVRQSAIVKTTPKTLYYENMLVGVPKSQTVNILNISDKVITMSPTVSFNSKADEFIDYDLLACEGLKCSPVDASKTFRLNSGESLKVEIPITLKKALNSDDRANGISMRGSVIIKGEVEAKDGSIKKIVPDNEDAKDDFLSVTGISDSTLILFIIGPLLIAAGAFMLIVAKRRRRETQK